MKVFIIVISIIVLTTLLLFCLFSFMAGVEEHKEHGIGKKDERI